MFSNLKTKQLIAGIRTCFLNKQIVLFDEISSALDSDLEEALRSLVLFIQKNSLTIIVAHRMETIMNADRIYVIDQGVIDSCGKHGDLMEMSHKYREFIAELSSGQ